MTYNTNPERNLNRTTEQTTDPARQVADRAKDIAGDVRSKAEEALGSVQGFDLSRQIREQPWLYLGAAAAAAFLLTRLGGRDGGSRDWDHNQQYWQQGQQPWQQHQQTWHGQPTWQQGQQSQQPWQQHQQGWQFGQQGQQHWQNPQAHQAAMEQVKQYESSQREGMVGKLTRKMSTSYQSLDQLFHSELQGIYDAEHQILKALPMQIEAATSPELKRSFDMHLHQTQEQIRRLEQLFQRMGQQPKGKACEAMSGILMEGQEVIGMRGDPEVKDAALIGAAQRVEHYEIASYGTLRTWARQLGHHDAAQLLQQSLNEEEQTDRQLTQLAERSINQRAVNR